LDVQLGNGCEIYLAEWVEAGGERDRGFEKGDLVFE
jgi:hypothetical protein